MSPKTTAYKLKTYISKEWTAIFTEIKVFQGMELKNTLTIMQPPSSNVFCSSSSLYNEVATPSSYIHGIYKYCYKEGEYMRTIFFFFTKYYEYIYIFLLQR